MGAGNAASNNILPCCCLDASITGLLLFDLAWCDGRKQF
jgi:hypothetical protein